MDHPLETVHEPDERRLLEQGEILVVRAGRVKRDTTFAPDSALGVERSELVRAQRECRELKIFAEGAVILEKRRSFGEYLQLSAFSLRSDQLAPLHT